MKKNSVLIPIDGSDFSLQILPLVQRFLNPAENRLILLHIEQEPEGVHIHRPGFSDIHIFVDLEEEGERINFSDRMLPLVRSLEAASFEVTTEVHFGKPAQAIETFMAQQPVDMVAMTTHGRTGLEQLVAGSVAEHVLHHSRAPMLLFHPSAETPMASLPPLL
jgi:nucleotide-binding universal stress UspA family protein